MEEEHHKLTLPGLPPLPKSLSAAIGQPNSSSSPLSHVHAHFLDPELYLGASTSAAASSHRQRVGGANSSNSYRHGSLSSTQESLSDRESIHSRASSTHSAGGGGHLSHYGQQQHTPTNNNHSSHSSNNNSHNHHASRTDSDSTSGSSTTTKLDTQLAILRREMYGLRQLDLSLLSQLWALNESIQGFRAYIQEQEALSPPSPSPTPSETNSLTSEPDEESYSGQHAVPVKLVPQTPTANVQSLLPKRGSTTSHASSTSTSNTSGSSSNNSSISKHQHHSSGGGGGGFPSPNIVGLMPPQAPLPQKSHPQLPRILQQRMRRAPPPPPPNRPKSSTSITSNSSHGGGGGGGSVHHHHSTATSSKSSSPSPSPGGGGGGGLTSQSSSSMASRHV
ncbi:optomotor-blind protein [Stomoxys calcitrans]|uniref:optomotor-blind protein n=1 Tax=Stomoxys calcitrans TaxID=35570 RepID=UPI0027E31442|nr:optomotor-blind protein [Stomoxys calcitrans]XP_059221818.1 optomotor-blind protein [Stomoxys calcitrans]